MELLRKIFQWLLSVGIFAIGCSHPPPITIDSAYSDCAWNQGGGGSDRASYSPVNSSSSGELVWTRNFKKYITVEPTAAFGKILVPSTDNKLYVISDIDGSEIAKRKYREQLVAPVIIEDSLAVLMLDGEKIMVENWIVHHTLWEADLNGSFIEPLLLDGNIYWIDGKNYLRCYRLKDGVRIWDRKLEGHFSSALSGSSGGVLVAQDGGVIYCYEKDSGKPRWTYNTGGRIHNPLVIAEEHVIFCSPEGRIGKLRLSDGASVWITELDSPVMAPVATDGEGIFVGTNDRYICRIDFDSGEISWRERIGGPVKAGPTLTEKLVVFVGIDYRAYFADKISGDILYRFKAGGMLTTRPLACNGRIYIAGEDKKLYCFDITGEK